VGKKQAQRFPRGCKDEVEFNNVHGFSKVGVPASWQGANDLVTRQQHGAGHDL
jgi:hypothetical protein